jgi:hypothetical protein
LRDCGLTGPGQEQARHQIRRLLGEEAYAGIELVVCSPLTRALHTAVLAFGGSDSGSGDDSGDDQDRKPILVHYDLREVGSAIPENTPRRMSCVLRDLNIIRVGSPHDTDNASSRYSHYANNFWCTIDVDSLRPENWPHRHDTPPKVIRRDRIKRVFSDWLAARPETSIAVVCHYHVIRAALAPADPYYDYYNKHASSPRSSRRRRSNGNSTTHGTIQPQNAVPIVCVLTKDGRLSLAGPSSLSSLSTPPCLDVSVDDSTTPVDGLSGDPTTTPTPPHSATPRHSLARTPTTTPTTPTTTPTTTTPSPRPDRRRAPRSTTTTLSSSKRQDTPPQTAALYPAPVTKQRQRQQQQQQQQT